MEALRQAAMNTNFKAVGFKKSPLNAEGYRRRQCPVSGSVCGFCTARPLAAFQVYNVIPRRKAVISMASNYPKSKKNAKSSPDDGFDGYFPEYIYLKKAHKDGDKTLPLPDFADASEEELITSLDLQLESATGPTKTCHYEIMYLIHEHHANEVQEVVSMVRDFIEERKGKIWRLNDWGMRKLAYKIKKTTKANYILMNFEIGAEYINELKNLLDKDERIIRHLVINQKEAITEDCLPPPEIEHVDYDDGSNMDEYDDDMDEYDDEVEGEYEEYEEEEEGDEEDMEVTDEYDDEEEDESEEEDGELESEELEGVKELAGW